MAALGHAWGSGVCSDEVLTVESLGAYQLGWAYRGSNQITGTPRLAVWWTLICIPKSAFHGSFKQRIDEGGKMGHESEKLGDYRLADASRLQTVCLHASQI